MSPEEPPPRPGLGLLRRAAVAAVLIVALSASAVTAAAFLQVDDIVNVIEQEGRAPIAIPEVTRAEAGDPQTLMILGSDERYLDKKTDAKPRSDTIILVRMDPDKRSTTVMSLPRDLKVEIPGHGTGKINSAYELGGPRLTVRTVKAALSQPGRPLKINHVINVDFGGFRRTVNYIGGVYVDIDRRYFNDNAQGQNYAAIDVEPGYQKLKGQDALDYVRYRHEDNDIVRGARQQDFLRQLRTQGGVARLLDFSKRRELATIFAKYTTTDAGLRKKKQIFSLLKLVLGTIKNPVREVRFDVEDQGDELSGQYLITSQKSIDKAVDQFFAARASGGPRGTLKSTAADKKLARKSDRKGRNRAAAVPGLEVAKREGEDQAILYPPSQKRALPFYFPTYRTTGASYSGTKPRTYSLRDEQGKKRRAYRLVIKKSLNGEYYGVQGLTWKAPPILDNPTETRTVNGRKLELHYDGKRLRLVAFRTPRAAYWVSNTLLMTLTNKQMIAIAASLKRLGQK